MFLVFKIVAIVAIWTLVGFGVAIVFGNVAAQGNPKYPK